MLDKNLKYSYRKPNFCMAFRFMHKDAIFKKEKYSTLKYDTYNLFWKVSKCKYYKVLMTMNR